ncbi:hypothetical protein ABIE65_001297 [Constrictibacter sp. MBR-5]|jgi:hypothetical protein|uniref:DUF3750 domain-containing protein n=1 Tax=Constrictibacter sp. MBR-5 TaxID=3156467 RepID=UPI003396F779
MLDLLRTALLAFAILFVLPIGLAAGVYFARDHGVDWRAADRSSSGLLPAAARNTPAVVRIFAARTVRWRGIFATHTWIVIKDAGEDAYTRYDYTAWGQPIRVNGFVADGRWFGRYPELVYAADGESAARLIPKMKAAIASYSYSEYGDYRAWPGPNSNTFVAAVMEAVPEIRKALPPTAIGKDYPHHGRWLAPTPSGTGFRMTLGGYLTLTVGWIEGLEFSLLGAVVGLDIRRPAVKLPALGRVGM